MPATAGKRKKGETVERIKYREPKRLSDRLTEHEHQLLVMKLENLHGARTKNETALLEKLGRWK